ncbi:MAG: hypothetical protein K2X47_20055 [Bdellovibrionales bacterium]|nr:hypothetical protein [Bdellovibrionales bacterium]
MTISLRFLVLIYLILPACVGIVIVDHFFLGGALGHNLPRTPNSLALFSLFFVLPHIVGSTITFLDPEYIRHYRSKLIWGVVLTAAVAFALPILTPALIVLVLNGVLTIYHVLAQQFGLTSAIGKFGGRPFQIWKYTGLLVGGVVYYLFYFAEKLDSSTLHWMQTLILVLLGLFLITTVATHRLVKTKLGKTYLWSNFLLVGGAFFFIRTQYYFFAMLVPRVIHDLTAFHFYIAHDTNRNRESSRNFIYSLFAKNPALRWLPISCVSPIVSITFGLGLSWLQIVSVANFFTLFHYWTENFSWKGQSLHRTQIHWG